MANKEIAKRGINKETVIIAIVVLYFVFLIRQDWISSNELMLERGKLSRDIFVSEKRKAELKKEISLLNDDSYIELVARQKLGLIKKGEEPYKVVR